MHNHRPRLHWQLPLLLFLATCLTTTAFRLGFNDSVIYQFCVSLLLTVTDIDQAKKAWELFGSVLYEALEFSVPLMFILTCHEFGHYFQSRRYRVRSSLPYFIPLPFGPFGTFGAVIAMDGDIPHSKALFDIGISGPLAGLIPTLVLLYFGIKWSYLVPITGEVDMMMGEPLLFQYVTQWIFGDIPPDMTLVLHPVAMASWAGLLLTSLNLMPFGQLDGGHVFHALLGRYAGPMSKFCFVTVLLLVIWFRLWHWSLILLLLAFIGVTHPPTANDTMPLSPFRRVLGWGTLAFILIGFTPTPLSLTEPVETEHPQELYCIVNPA
jgi:membrane-associated protease RseP (regulator of RpoE activity)